MAFNLTFPATRGIQAGRPFFTATIPFKVLARLFKSDEEEVPADLRAQRKLNEGRAQGICDYMITNPETFVIPAITVSCDQSMQFEKLHPDYEVGLLRIPMDACLLVNDGQHRRMGIALALREDPSLADQAVSATIFYDQGLSASKQLFCDINNNACKPSGSISALYDLRNPFAGFVMSILNRLPKIKARLDMEAASPAKKSSHLWSLIAFHIFVGTLTKLNEKNIGKIANLDAKVDFVVDFCAKLDLIPLWQSMLEGKMGAEEMRESFVVSHAVFLNALGVLGSYITDLSQLDGLAEVDPSKGSPAWQGRCVVMGKMNKTTSGVKSTAAVLMRLCGLPIPEDIKKVDALVLEVV